MSQSQQTQQKQSWSLKGKKLKVVYNTVKKVYYKNVKKNFKFKKGEKSRIKDVFTHIKEALKENEENTSFKNVLDFFEDYLDSKTKSWLAWDKKSRFNYIGFLLREEDIYVFIKGETIDDDEDLDMAGYNDSESWDF